LIVVIAVRCQADGVLQISKAWKLLLSISSCKMQVITKNYELCSPLFSCSKTEDVLFSCLC